MSQSKSDKEEIPVGVTAFGLIIMILFIILLFTILLKPDTSIKERISFGEKTLLPQSQFADSLKLKKQGMKAIENTSFLEAKKKLEEYIYTYLETKPKDPEALIFLNNARIKSKDKKSYTIAVSVPIEKNLDGSLEVLRGVAQAQQEIYLSEEKYGFLLEVAIASDDDNPDIAKQIAKALVDNPDIRGVVGHYASNTTLAAEPVYTSGKLVAISPVSTSVEISKKSPYIFRTVPSDAVAAKDLAKYMLGKLNQKKAAVFYDSKKSYSMSLKTQFNKAVLQAGGQVLDSDKFDFSDPSFNAATSVKQAIKQGVKVLLLAPDKNTLKEAVLVINANQKQKQPLKLLGGDGVYGQYVLENAGDTAVGMVVAIPWHIDSNPSPSFATESEKLWNGSVSWRTALAYDATIALAEGIKRNPSRPEVQKIFSSGIKLATGATGDIQFLPSGERQDAPVQLVVVEVDPNKQPSHYKFVPVRR